MRYRALRLDFGGRISRMTATGSSLATRFRWPRPWRDFAAFVRRPALPERMTGITRPAFGAVASLFALDLLASFAIVAVFFGLDAAGIELPTNALDGATFDTILIVLIAFGAPLAEELIFRGWLSGRPAAWSVVKYLVAGFLLGGLATGFAGPLAGLGVGVTALALTIYECWRRRGLPAGRWYVRHFRWFYFGSALAFAAAHLLNYGEGGGLLTLLVLPQFVAGLVLGYARVIYGLWASIAMHAAFNSLIVALILLSGEARLT